MNEYAHSDNFEYKGIWWLPENPDRGVAGTVSFDGKGINLELSGLLHEPADFEERDLQPDFILGRVRQGRLITLYQAFETGSTVPVAGGHPEPPIPYFSSFGALHMFVGAHFTSQSEMQFSALSASFTYLEEWMGVERIPFRRSFDLEEGTETVTYSYPERIEITVREIRSRILFSSQLTQKGDTFRTRRWEHEARVWIYPEEQQDFGWCQNVLGTCQLLFTLLIGRAVHPKRIQAHVPGTHETFTPYGEIQGAVDIFSLQYSDSIRRDTRPPLQHWNWRHVLVPLPAIEADLEQIFNAWFEKERSLRPVYELYFGALYNPQMYVDTEFLTLAQALESYHSRTSLGGSDRYFPDEEYAVHQEAMLSVLPEDVRQTLNLRDRLQYLNRYTLKKRLDELLERVGYPIRTYLTDHPGRFTRRITDTRNYLTHYSEELRGRTLGEEEFYGVNQKLRVWLMALLLLELDISYETVLTAAQEFRNLYFVRED